MYEDLQKYFLIIPLSIIRNFSHFPHEYNKRCVTFEYGCNSWLELKNWKKKLHEREDRSSNETKIKILMFY